MKNHLADASIPSENKSVAVKIAFKVFFFHVWVWTEILFWERWNVLLDVHHKLQKIKRYFAEHWFE